MDAMDMVLDLTHMADEACREALELFRGPIVATHANPRRVVDRTRLIPDEVIQGIAAHDGAVGIMPANWALVPGWKKGDSKEGVGLEMVVDAIDAVCQITGSDRHVGIGTDFDGGFGAEMAPAELDTISDLQKVASVLERRGYAPASIEAILHGNWLRLARRSLDTS
jgi:membrane dipeptidase